MHTPFDDDLRLARSGDREALARILQRSQGRLERLAQRRLGGGLRARVRASDVLQSTYLEVVRRVDAFEGDSQEDFLRWVGVILENNIRQKRRYFNARKRATPEESGPAEIERPSPIATPSAQAALRDDLNVAGRALDGLPEDYRRVIMLRVVEARSHEEIAREMGRSVPATRMLLSRARAALSLEIEKLGPLDAN